MNKQVKYVGFYDLVDSKHQRSAYLSAINKMNYIAETIVATGKKVEIVSPAWFIDKSAPITMKKNVNISEDIQLILAPSFPTRNRVTGKFKYYFSQFWMFLWLINNIQKNEEIIAYHSLALITPLYWAKKIKRFNLIYEVEEIYTDVINYGKLKRKYEFKMFNCADKYIFPTKLLNEKINKEDKPYTIIHGTYKVEKNRDCKFNDDRIHIVYAGTFDPIKGGAISTANSAEYLGENYHIHIIGFGTDEQIKNLKDKISQISKKTKCRLTYDGIYSGEEYIKFLQKCDIGLSTQNPDGEYNDTSFPSKVLSYMVNGLRVVSTKIKVLKESKINDLIYYYEGNTPKAIANAIKNIDFYDGYNSIKTIERLNSEFTENMELLLEARNMESNSKS
ncbi:Uncharacterised protein [[Clostridium] sordellii]|uniref:glycosyltransferase n=1 Tax=Paraclostridium sordellii TaxID=1505 RepID=UPI0005DF14C0|nr:glycosyltransferase [Paeniclostridium sordellii]CEN76501.1 Uncharacterised protein [[Clostridium] sordellii] [Paeniclostridium sordellii]